MLHAGGPKTMKKPTKEEEMTYTTKQLEQMGFRIENDWELYVDGDWVGTDENKGGATIDMSVEYLFHAEPDDNGVWDIDDGQYAVGATVRSIDFWNGEGEPPFRVGEYFDTLDEVSFESCRELSYLQDA